MEQSSSLNSLFVNKGNIFQGCVGMVNTDKLVGILKPVQRDGGSYRISVSCLPA